MPPRKTITKDIIIAQGLELSREKGLTALAARPLARKMNCSTQPIYSCFATMEELQQAVLEKAFHTAVGTYLIRPGEKPVKFLDIGLGYLRMSRKDPHLYDMLYGTGHTSPNRWIFPVKEETILKAMAEDGLLGPMTPKEKLKILPHMAVYTHGLVMLGRVNPDLDPADLEKNLEEMGRIVIGNALLEKGVPDHENPCLKRQP